LFQTIQSERFCAFFHQPSEMPRTRVVLLIFITFCSGHKTTIKSNEVRPTERNHCTFLEPDTLLCLHEIKDTLNYRNVTRELILCDWTEKDFDPQLLTPFVNLENITMFNNNFTGFVDEFPMLKRLKVSSE
jgi:hypothetical protein